MSGIFGAYAAHAAKRRQHTAKQKAVIAELVSEGWSVAAAGRELGVTQQRASTVWREIVRDMGAQAV